MRIIEPSATIIEDELSRLSVYQRIDRCTSVCYQRPPKPTEEEAQAFCKKLLGMGHLAALEMAVIHLFIDTEVFDPPQSKFIFLYRGGRIVTGSVRALLESSAGGLWVGAFLHHSYPSLFSMVHGKDFKSRHEGVIRPAWPDEIPWQHKHVAVRFIVNRAVSHELVRHRPASYLQECLAGDVMVQSFSGEKKWSMARLYDIFTNAQCGLARSKIRIRTRTPEGEIVPTKILNVFKSGIKKVYRVTTRNGRSIVASGNHIFITPKGDVRLRDLRIGDKLYMNGVRITKEWLSHQYLVLNRERAHIAKELGVSDSWLGKKISLWGIQKPKSQYPNRKPGRGVKGMHSMEGKQEISARMSKENNHRWKGDNVSVGGGYSRTHRHISAKGNTCVCGYPATEIHHIDRNPRNTNSDNIEFCCTPCHKARHKQGAYISWEDTIESIQFIGEEVTYDLEVDNPNHNFSANGFFVHNSQRYCRYEDEVVFIRPEWFVGGDLTARVLWETHVEDAERRYKMLLKQGLKPQQARAVLPNSTKTEIICYASLPQWKHIFGLRCAPAADPEMRRVMIPLYENSLAKYPEAFV